MKSSILDAYYRTELLYSQVLEILHGNDQDGSATAQDAKGINIADLLMAVAQVERLLNATAPADGRALTASTSPAGGEDSGLLGVTPGLLHRTTGLADERITQFHRDAARHALLPRVEDKLREMCSDVCEVMLPELLDRSPGSASEYASISSSTAVAAGSTARQVMEIPALILELQSLKQQKERNVVALQRQLHTQLREDLQRLQAMIYSVQTLLKQYKQQDAPRVLHAKMQWLTAYSRAMSLRAKVLTKQVLVETYPRDQAALLQGVHKALEERRQRAVDEHEQLQAKLHLYRSGDAEYQTIVRQYASVRQSTVEKKKWIQSLNM